MTRRRGTFCWRFCACSGTGTERRSDRSDGTVGPFRPGTAKREIVTRDIQIAAEKGLGGIDQYGDNYTVDLERFFDQWVRGTGIPQFKFEYHVRQAEDGQYLIEGLIRQRVVVGSRRALRVLEGRTFRGVVDITVLAKKGKEYGSRVVVQDPETPFRLKVPDKPLEIALNKHGGVLAHDVVTVAGDW